VCVVVVVFFFHLNKENRAAMLYICHVSKEKKGKEKKRKEKKKGKEKEKKRKEKKRKEKKRKKKTSTCTLHVLMASHDGS
jgi:hypothetical protein